MFVIAFSRIQAYMITLLRSKISMEKFMPRPKRKGWKPVTLTLSEEAARLLRVHSADRGVEMGTLATSLIMAQLVEVNIPQPRRDGKLRNIPKQDLS
jgi:hypothetical protein